MSEQAIYLEAIGIRAPGLPDWSAFVDAMQHDNWAPSDDWSVTPVCLSPRQSKRLSDTTRLALACAEQIGDSIASDAGWVFASSLGEGLTLDVILNALSEEEEILVSPVKFQNAVHNAAVGQWTIAKTLQGPSTSIAAFDETAGAGMLKAWMQCSLEQIPVGLVVYDWPLPEPLHSKRPMIVPLAVALAFSPAATEHSMCRLTCKPGQTRTSEPISSLARSLTGSGNPVAALLPMLEQIASDSPGKISLALSGGSSLDIEMTRP